MIRETTLPKLPPKIKPRTLLAAPHGRGFITSDGRYRMTPTYARNVLGGRSRIDGWNVERDEGTRTAPRWVHRMQTSGTLEDVRNDYCTPLSRMPWLVCDMDTKILRIAHNRAAARDWAQDHLDAQKLRAVGHVKGDTCWEYQDPEGDSVFVMRADHAHQHGFDAEMEPFYPYPDQPNEPGPRGLAYQQEH